MLAYLVAHHTSELGKYHIFFLPGIIQEEWRECKAFFFTGPLPLGTHRKIEETWDGTKYTVFCWVFHDKNGEAGHHLYLFLRKKNFLFCYYMAAHRFGKYLWYVNKSNLVVCWHLSNGGVRDQAGIYS